MMAFSDQAISSCIERMSTGILVTDPEGYVLYHNIAYRHLTQLKDIEMGDDLHTFMEDGRIFGEPAALEAVRLRQNVIRQFNSDDRGIFIVSQSEPIFAADGKLEYVVTRVNDATRFFAARDDIENTRLIVEKVAADIDKYNDYGSNVIAISDNMRAVLDMGQKVAGFDMSVLITGESGTGKDVVAHFIHDHSNRANGPFVAVNCAAIPENLLETELFGYSKGVFTGQVKEGKKGLFEAARGGTLFLDEIGDMPLSLQAKVLRVLEARSYMPVGSTVPVDTDVRILAATNKDLRQMVGEGRFREDLLYRLNVVELKVPPLRDRRDDIIPLALFFLELFNNKYKTHKRIGPIAMHHLRAYQWPGNIRQLKNVIEMMIALGKNDEMSVPPMILRQIKMYDEKEAASKTEVSGEMRPEKDGGQGIMPIENYMAGVEKEYLKAVYKQCGSTRKAAKALEIDHSTMMRKLKKYGIRLENL